VPSHALVPELGGKRTLAEFPQVQALEKERAHVLLVDGLALAVSDRPRNFRRVAVPGCPRGRVPIPQLGPRLSFLALLAAPQAAFHLLAQLALSPVLLVLRPAPLAILLIPLFPALLPSRLLFEHASVGLFKHLLPHVSGILLFRHALELALRADLFVRVYVDRLAVDALPVQSRLVVRHGIEQRLPKCRFRVQRRRVVDVGRRRRPMSPAVASPVPVPVTDRMIAALLVTSPWGAAARP